jgi:(p)ppGpp synthase/HD superfamily hydrolase
MDTRAHSNIRMHKIKEMGNFTNCAHWSYKMEKIRAFQTSKKHEEE